MSSRDYFDRLAEAVWMTAAEITSGNEALRYKYPPLGPGRLPSLDEVQENHRRLLNDRPKLAYVTRRRGVSMTVVKRYLIGHDGEAYWLPVFDWTQPFPVIVNLRKYRLHADPKITSLAGRGAQLYTPIPDGPMALLCEGEWDALVAESLVFPAVTQTGGSQHWPDEYCERVGHRHVVVVYDRDNGGLLGEAKVRDAFERVGLHKSLTVIELPLPFTEKRGADLSDYLAAHTAAEFEALLRHAYLKARSPGQSRDSRRALPTVAAKVRKEVSS